MRTSTPLWGCAPLRRTRLVTSLEITSFRALERHAPKVRNEHLREQLARGARGAAIQREALFDFSILSPMRPAWRRPFPDSGGGSVETRSARAPRR